MGEPFPCRRPSCQASPAAVAPALPPTPTRLQRSPAGRPCPGGASYGIRKTYRGATMNLIAVRSSPSIMMSVNAGMQTRSTPLGATKPLAMATALTAWFTAPAPMAWSSALPRSRTTAASAPATALGLLLEDTFKTSIAARLLVATGRFRIVFNIQPHWSCPRLVQSALEGGGWGR